MFKKICILLCIIIGTFSTVSACVDLLGKPIECPSCEYNAGDDIKTQIEGCVGWSGLIQKTDLKVKGGFKDEIVLWVKQIRKYLAIGAIFAIVLWAFKMTLSIGDDEKISGAKKIVQWGILGLIGILAAGLLIQVVVETMYKL